MSTKLRIEDSGQEPRGAHDRLEATGRDWTIKRLDRETIDVSREAAKRCGMKINAWVGQALERAATENLSDSGPYKFESVIKIEEHILTEIEKLRAQNEDLVQTVNSMSALLMKMYTNR